MSQSEIIIAVNPGSTSTKMARFAGDERVECETIYHSSSSLSGFRTIWDQFAFRLSLAREWMTKSGRTASAVVGIGGLLKPVSRGTFRVNDNMLRDARANLQGAHPSNLGCAIAYELGQESHCPSFIVDPVSVDEFSPLARYSGHPLIARKSLSHALNIHASARRAATTIGKPYEQTGFVIAHLGGGISVAPVLGGRIVDVNDASSDGPFSPERSGGLPLQQFITLCFSGGLTEAEARSMVMGKGGLRAYLGSNSGTDIETEIERGTGKAKEVVEAMCYQIAKEIGAMATVLAGDVDAIVLTGGLASWNRIVEGVSSRTRRIAPIIVFPGEDEMQAMANGVLRVLRGQEQEREY